MGRPPFQPTDEMRRTVSIAAGGGQTHEEIALALGIDRKTLEKHFEAELSTHAYQRRMEVLEAMHAAALKGNVAAQKAYLSLDPELAAPPLPKEPDKAKPGKKEQADIDAVTAQEGTGWGDLLPKNSRAPATLQ